MKAWNTFKQNLAKISTEMESRKQLSIIQFFHKNSNSKNEVSGFNKIDEEGRPMTSIVQHGLKRSCDVDTDYAETSKKQKGDFIRQYDKKYLELGFTVAPNSEKVPLPMCLVSAKILSNDAMKPSKFTRHFNSLHSNLVGKPLAYFKRLLSETENQKDEIRKITTSEKALLKPSYLFALQIGKSKKPYTIGEDLIKPCMLAAAEQVLGSEAVSKLQAIPISNDRVKRRIIDMAVDIEEQVIEQVMKSKYFSIQLYESTDLSNCAILACFVRFENEGSIMEEFLCSLKLLGQTTSSEIFKTLNNYVQEHNLDWGKCVGVCTDGAANMIGCHSGVTAKIREVANQDLWICILHRELLSSKKMSPELNNVIKDAVKIVNYIRGRALHSRLFEALCDSMGSQHRHLLFHAEVRWLSRGHVFTRLFELREEVEIFLHERKSSLENLLTDEMWKAKLAYLADIFSRLNDLNISLQGNHTNIFTLHNKTDAFKKKLVFWYSNVQKGCIEMFPCLQDVAEKPSVITEEIFALISQHLKKLAISFDQYFPENADP